MVAQMKELEMILGYNFNDEELLRQALTRGSAINEKNPDASEKSFETLEFVGDAALKHAIAQLLYRKHRENSTEYVLHMGTVELIKNSFLSTIGKEMQLEKFLLMGKGEKNLTNKDRLLADGVEAILGAVSLDTNSKNDLLDVVLRFWKPYLELSTSHALQFCLKEANTDHKGYTLKSSNGNVITYGKCGKMDSIPWKMCIFVMRFILLLILLYVSLVIMSNLPNL
ncbi:unnamed protein product [Didymodactylos carnosus]|uniref:RNase III domain-containing protein n=1 Tax=Didymodactylos carnosus TaxID=1234261 RepID=A0A814KWJ7_9BILA|nr:unnamed protein product [Didymodactylos carnosus]CAF1056304.1 unnamed protein product [Didymodactylos carnosus]CAF3661200.1 unnamed protein product [Didymodactylos carnosus]CAF3825266.1 unnamed protein product [Didymodactylos carnosus]